MEGGVPPPTIAKILHPYLWPPAPTTYFSNNFLQKFANYQQLLDKNGSSSDREEILKICCIEFHLVYTAGMTREWD